MEEQTKNLPPKLNLRKDGVLKTVSAGPAESPVAAKPVAPVISGDARPAISIARPAAVPAAAPVAAKPVTPVISGDARPAISIARPAAVSAAAPVAAKPVTPVMSGDARHTISITRPAAVPAASGAAPVVAKPVVPAPKPGLSSVPLEESLEKTQDLSILPEPPAPAVGPKRPTIAAASTVQAGMQSSSVAAAKKETSKIPLEAAKPGLAGAKAVSGVTPKTIKIKPVSGAMSPKIGLTAPTVMKTPPVVQGEGLTSAVEKKKTSRISLDSALSPVTGEPLAAGSESGGPKTIKLKRPSEAITVKAGRMDQGPQSAEKTSKLDEEAGDGQEGASSTVRRTVRLKKSSLAAGTTAAIHHAPYRQEQYVDKANATFIVFSAAAIIIVFTTIWMFCAQVIGPDFSLTRASYYREGWDMPWYGKLHRYIQ